MIKQFTVPLPSYLKRFAAKELLNQVGDADIITVTERDLLGKHILLLLIDKRKIELSDRIADYDDSLTIELSDTLAKRSPDLQKLSRIVPYLHEQFKHALYFWTSAQITLGESRYQAALKFFANYGIDDDQLFDSMYTYLKRRTNREYFLRKKNLLKF